jgi:NTE family protein
MGAMGFVRFGAGRRPECPRVGIALGGGGAKGLAHVGVLRVLANEEIPIAFLAGVSMGAVVAAVYALTETLPDDRMIGSLNGRGFNPLASLGTPPGAERLRERFRHLVELERFLIDNLIGRAVGHETEVDAVLSELTAGRRLEESRIPVAVVACDLISGNPIVFRSGPATLALRASTTLPGIFPPVSYNGQLLVDGGFAGMVPTEVVRGMGADLVIAMDADPPHAVRDIRNGLEAMLRALDICSRRHKAWRLGQADLVIQPAFGEPIGAMDVSRGPQCVEAGARAAGAAGPEIRSLVSRTRPAAPRGRSRLGGGAADLGRRIRTRMRSSDAAYTEESANAGQDG